MPVPMCVIAITLAAIVQNGVKHCPGIAYVFRGGNFKVIPITKGNEDRPNAKSEVQLNGIMYSVDTPFEVATAPCVEQPQPGQPAPEPTKCEKTPDNPVNVPKVSKTNEVMDRPPKPPKLKKKRL